MQTLSLTEKEVTDLVRVPEGDYIIARFEGDLRGPTVLVFGSIHGNEHSGVKALKKVARELERANAATTGDVYLIAGNTRAINKNVRYIETDLNRHWTPENIARNHPDARIRIRQGEDIEQAEILAIVSEALSRVRGEVYALDLHSTSSKSTPFAMVGDTIRNRTFAEKFPATFLLGIEEQLDGTILEYMNELGAVTLGFEAGQHTTEAAVKNQEALIWLALANSGAINPGDFPIERHRAFLANAMGHKRIIEIRHRHAIKAEDQFRMEPGYANFQKVRKGEVLGHDLRGPVKASEKGMILMPLYQLQGSDGFFLGREIKQFWLKLSRILRQIGAGAWIRFMPGVKRHPADDLSLIVNTRIARILPLQIFHLLGFRKRRWKGEKLVVSRRRHDTKSPFTTSG
ncbi:MAG: succinylglutamate desuccinylase/aspartoacylase family protein [Acidobacteriota bacterium]|nr:succinylglutamate desuccinylase/aspartoacylase family protein [Acidobacteriota bacterium]